MPYEKGDEIIVGLGLEGTRGTAVSPQVYIPGRTPSGVKVELDKKEVSETVASGMKTQGSEITNKRGVGDLEFNLRAESIGYILKSLLGACASTPNDAPNADAINHVFTLDTNVEAPSLTLGLQKTIQAYRYLLTLVSSLELTVNPDDLVIAKVGFLSKKEEENSQYVPAFQETDVYFRQQDVSVKFADDLSGLDAAEASVVKSLGLTISAGVEGNPRIGDLYFDNILSKVREIKGSVELSYQAKTLYDLFKVGTYKAMRIEMERSDITIGDSLHPKLTIDLPRISFENYDQERALDDIVTEKIEFSAHYDNSEASGIKVTLVNEVTEYEPTEESPS